MFTTCIYFLIEYMYINIYVCIYIVYMIAHSYPIQDLPTTWVSQDDVHFTVALV